MKGHKVTFDLPSSDGDPVRSFDISNSKYRVGAPPLCPLPVLSSNLGAPEVIRLSRKFGIRIDKLARPILDKMNIEWSDTYFVHRTFATEPTNPRMTFLVEADWTNDAPRKWQAAVRELKQVLDSLMMSSVETMGLDVTVEMVAPELGWRKYLSIIEADENFPRLAAEWSQIRRDTLAVLGTFGLSLQKQISSIALFRLGYDEIRKNNPKTVYVSVDHTVDELSFDKIAQAAQEYLDGTGHGLVFHIEYGMPEVDPLPLLADGPESTPEKKACIALEPMKPYSKSANLGDDIGAATNPTRDDGLRRYPLLGTLGCYLEIQTTKSQGAWVKVALTSYHVVRPALEGFLIGTKDVTNGGKETTVLDPPRDSPLFSADRTGFHPITANQRTMVEHPSRYRFNKDTVLIRALVGNPNYPWAEALLKEKTDFFDCGDHLFATAWFGSGLPRHTANNGRLDWALLKPTNEGVGTNRLPSLHAWNSKGYYVSTPDLDGLDTVLKDPPAGGSHLDHGDPVFKVGAATGITSGQFSCLKSGMGLNEDAYMPSLSPGSTEFTFIGSLRDFQESPPFAQKGDSGAAVYDSSGRIIGLIFKTRIPQQCEESFTYVTPIEDIFADIIKMSNGGVKAIRVAQ